MSLKALLPMGVFAGLVALFAVGLTRDPSALPSELLDRPFPAFELATLRDDAARLDETALAAGEVSLVNVFGSWCVSCVVEHPVLMDLTGEVRLVGVNWRDTRPDAARWLERYGDPYDLILFDAESRLAIDLGVAGAPETFVVDGEGRIRYKHVGPISDVDWTGTLRPLVERLREEREEAQG